MNTWIKTDIYPQRYIFNDLKLNKKYNLLDEPFNLSDDYSYDFIVSVDKVYYSLDSPPYIEVFDNRTLVEKDSYMFTVKYIGEAPIDIEKCRFSIFIIGSKLYKPISSKGEWKSLPIPKTMEVKKVKSSNPYFDLINKSPKNLKFFSRPTIISFDEQQYTPNMNINVEKKLLNYFVDFGFKQVEEGKQTFKQSSRGGDRYTPIRNYPQSFVLPIDSTKTTCNVLCSIAISPQNRENLLRGKQEMFTVTYYYYDGSSDTEIIYHSFDNEYNMKKDFFKLFPPMSKEDENILFPPNVRGDGGLQEHFDPSLILGYTVNTTLKLKKPTKSIKIAITNPKMQQNYWEDGFQYEYTLFATWFVGEKGSRLVDKKSTICDEVEVICLYD